MDRDVLARQADIIFETTNGTNNHVWINTYKRTIYTGTGAGNKQVLYRYFEDSDEFISYIVMLSQQHSNFNPTYRCVKGNEYLWDSIACMDADEIFDRVRSVNEEVANSLLI